MKTIKLGWEELDEMVSALADKIKQSDIRPKVIYGIPRGGLIVAVMLSHKLGGMPITNNPRENFVLFVDDISDEGKSLLYHSRGSDCFATATLIARTEKFAPDFIALETDTSTFYIFPWENEGREKYAGKLESEEYYEEEDDLL